ncbi:MAG: SHOCT domain-containing protein [Angelakisella sp.]|jgi:hypothetical protein|nr:SHOCT domain-containing protein [Angelakisella sp.]
MRRRSYRYRPNKVQSAVGIAAGGLFILLGLFFVIPTFGFFGIIWTLFAVGITASNAYAAFSGKGYGSLEMEERDGPGESSGGLDFEEKLQKLQRLYEQRLITREEYEQKRAEILAEKW